MIKNRSLWKSVGLVVLLSVVMVTVHYQLKVRIDSMQHRVQSLKKNKQLSNDFLANKNHYVFESRVALNSYISEFISRAMKKEASSSSSELFTYFRQKKLKKVTFFQSYLPVDVVEFDIGINSRFMSILSLAEKLKKSPFIVVWKHFRFSIDEKAYPMGHARLVFYTFIKRSS